MPGELAPGVYVEETGIGPKPIVGVATHVTAFLGPTALVPEEPDPDDPHPLLTSWGEYERLYGGADDLEISGAVRPNYLALAVRAFFENGGRKLHVAPLPGDEEPTPAAYEAALDSLLRLDAVSLIAAPGASSLAGPDHQAVEAMLIAHAETAPGRRFAVLDTPPGLDLAGAKAARSRIDSKYAALYFPWIRIADPLAATDPSRPREIAVPPSGAVCGIYARTDIERGVFKAPANELVAGAVGLERSISSREQEPLNAAGLNCIRVFAGRGIRLWGARTASSDPEWKYVNVRRYLTYLERSIDKGTQWAVFEPNDEPLWARIRTLVTDFLLLEWRNGALLGDRPQHAFYFRCDRRTMTQDNIDNGRLVMEVGVATVRPAEFIIFRIGQWTADRPDDDD